MSLPANCPKCQRTPLPNEAACGRCGLKRSRWATFAEELPSHPVLDALWKKVEEAWDDDACHTRFIDEASALGALDLAAARYRKRLRSSDGNDDPRAQAGLDRAARLVLSQNVAPSRDEGAAVLGSAARTLKWVGVVAAAALLGATVWVLFIAMTRR